MSSLLCVGIATLDYIYGVGALPAQGRKYRAGALEIVGGGIAANAAVAAARLGGAALLATRLGDDAAGDTIRAGLAAEGIDLALSKPVTGGRSPISAIMVDPAGERMIVSYSDADMPEEPDWLAQRLPDGVGAVLGDTRWEQGALRLLLLARQSGLPAILDGDRKPANPALLAVATHIAFSEVGLAELTGLDDPAAALRSLDLGERWLAVTLGPAGVLVAEGGEIRHHAAFAIEAVDTLGAGDVWHGAFALALAERRSEAEAVRFASAAAAIKCSRFGGRKGAPMRAEVERFLKDNP